jgi:DNA sulfur modification protein DndD
VIINELKLTNFCIYRGEHEFNLAPTVVRGKAKPVVLFGGMNGGGKTTILDAVQLALYGKRAKCSKRGEKSYEDFLRSCINHQIDPQMGASIGLTFLYASEGTEHVYEVQRMWAAGSGGAIRERVLILKDGEPDHWMAENWNQLVDDLIPFGVAQLCFFDAEKIRFLAEDETSNVALGDAIKALLGLDLAERLVADSAVLEGRLTKKIKKSDDFEALTKLEESWREKKANVERLKQDRASIVPQLERAQSRALKAEANFAKVGGKHWEQREQRTQQKGELQTTVQHCEESLVNLASGALPLALVDDLLAQVAEQAQKERSAAQSGFLTSLLSRRDKDLLKTLKSAKASDDVVKVASEFLDTDRQKRASADDVEAWLDLPDVSARRLDELLEGGLTKRLEESVELLTRLEDAQRDLENVERSLAAAPKEDAIKDVAAELKAATSEVAELLQQFNRIEAELKPAEFEVADLDKQIAKLRHKSIDEQMSHDQNARVSALVRRTQDTMREFLRRATERKIARLSDLVTKSFRYLLRKQQLVERVVIDPTDFSITIVDQSGAVLPKERLSEGEKQIFAISVLWGLSQASARPLPAIIDTPMGRLDSEHRNQLVERYFPHASHQVIILSTDTEIEGNYFEQLQPSVARAYHLNYDEAGRMTHVEEGYFWKAADAKVIA